MVTASLPRSASFLSDLGSANLSQVRLLRRVADQDQYERTELRELAKHGVGGKSADLADGIVAFAIDNIADAEEKLTTDGSPLALAVLGMVYAEAEELEDAADVLRKAVPNLPQAGYELVRVLIADDKADEADALIDDLPDGAEREFCCGLLDEAQGKVERAIASYEAALERDPEHVEAAFKLGVLLDRIGDDDMAIEYYLVCADVHPHFLPGVINLAVLYDERGESNAAIDCLRQVLAYGSDNNRAKMLLRDCQASRSMYYDEREEREKDRMSKILKTPVNDFELSVRSRNCLAKMNIFTLGDLISITEQEMLNYKNFGETSLREVREMLDARNLRLGMLREDEDRGLNKQDQKTLQENTDKLELSSRTVQVLQSLNCSTIGDVCQFTDLDLYRTPSSGQSVVQELSTALGAYGLSLKKPDIAA